MKSKAGLEDRVAQGSRIAVKFGIVTVIGVVFTLIAFIYPVVFPKIPEITYTILSETNVLDINRPLDELSILYDGKDIRQQNLNLKIVQIRVENTGNVDIRKGDFDDEITWGLNVLNGKILNQPRIIDTSSVYLYDNIVPTLLTGSTFYVDTVALTIFNLDSLYNECFFTIVNEGVCEGESKEKVWEYKSDYNKNVDNHGQLVDLLLSNDTIQFRQCIFEIGEYFTTEFLVLHPLDKKPTISPIGKITNIEDFIVKQRLSEQSSSTRKQLLGSENDSFAKQLLIALFTISGFVIVVFSTIGILAMIVSGIYERNYFRRIYEGLLIDLHPEFYRDIGRCYRKGKLPLIEKMLDVLNRDDLIKAYVSTGPYGWISDSTEYSSTPSLENAFKWLVKLRIIEVDELKGTYTVNKELSKAIDLLTQALKK